MSEETIVLNPNGNTKICPCCGAEYSFSAKYCPECGYSELAVNTKHCSNCGASLTENQIFCSKCGTSTLPVSDTATTWDTSKPLETAETYEEAKKSKSKLVGGIIAAVVSVLIAIVLVISMIGAAIIAAIAAPAMNYEKANECQEAGDYLTAYNMFVELGDYKDSEDEVTATLLLWSAEALSSGDAAVVDEFCDAVVLDREDHYVAVYGAVTIFVNSHDEHTFWYYNYTTTVNTQNVVKLLNELPRSYEYTSEYLELFELLRDSYDFETIFIDNDSIIEKCWDVGFVRDMAGNDYAIEYFLRDRWTTYSGDYYIEFYESSGGGTSSVYNLPYVAEPSGTKYFDIEDMIYYYDGSNSNHLAKVFKFEFEEYDQIEVYCYKNNRTYTLYR